MCQFWFGKLIFNNCIDFSFLSVNILILKYPNFNDKKHAFGILQTVVKVYVTLELQTKNFYQIRFYCQYIL